MHSETKRYASVGAAWLPFFLIWLFFTILYGRLPLGSALLSSVIAMGSAGSLGAAVWAICKRRPWPIRLNAKFYGLHISLGIAYAIAWNLLVYALESVRRGQDLLSGAWKSPVFPWQFLMGFWLYVIFAGISYAVQTRNRLHEKEKLALRAEALAASACLDAIRARLNPHFLFNALHTLTALVKFRPALAEDAIERLGDILRYTLREDGRELVEFSEEYEFTRKYIAFEQLRYGNRLTVTLRIDPESFDFDIPPFSIQTLAENAVLHAISVRPEGGSIWITSACRGDRLSVSVRDDGPGNSIDPVDSHQFGLKSLQARLQAAFGSDSLLQIRSNADGFEALFEVASARHGVSESGLTEGTP